MFVKPKAIDFDAFVDGIKLPWNDEIGLVIRWMAAERAKSTRHIDLSVAASEATEFLKNPRMKVLPHAS